MSFLKKSLFISLFFALPFLCFAKSPPLSKTICLNMIVKDEHDVIARCLKSTLPLIDYYVIVDTGSSDDTKEIIRDFMKENGIPGEVHEQPWVNFAHNRNGALQLAKGKGDYLLFVDADEQLLYEPDFKMPELTHDFYFMDMTSSPVNGIKHSRIHLVNNHINWRWEGVLHEALASDEATKGSGKIERVLNYYSQDGARAKDPKKYEKDAAVLAEALKADPENTRYTFYLAQCYKDAGMPDKALIYYEKRAQMGGWGEEVYWSLVQTGALKEQLGKGSDEIAAGYKAAFKSRPSRVETLYFLAQHYRNKSEYQKAYDTAKLGMGIPTPKDFLFVADWIYDYGIALEVSIAAWWLGHYEEAKTISLDLLKKDLPDHVRTCVENNLAFTNAKLLEKME